MTPSRVLLLLSPRGSDIARWLMVVATAVAFISLPNPALAEEGEATFAFDPDSDRAAWYWKKQLDGSATEREGVVPPPQDAGTLPVALEGGQAEKVSALRLDLDVRGVPAGSEVTGFTVSIVEKTEVGELPAHTVVEPRIVACPISGLWPPAEAGKWRDVPAHAEEPCVTGQRQEAKGEARWVFDLTTLAGSWAQPMENRGFLLRGEPADAGAQDTWQVNLKRPSEDDPETEQDEYEQTRAYLTGSVTYAPPDSPPEPPRESVAPQAPAQEGTSRIPDQPVAQPPSFSVGNAPSAPSVQPPSVATPQAPATPSTPQVAQPAAVGLPAPVVPGSVWTLVPVGLLLLGIVSWIVWERDPQGRPLWMRAMGFEDPRSVHDRAPMIEAPREQREAIGVR